MSSPEQRLQEIEIKLTFLENHVSEQDRVILQLRDQIDRQQRRIDELTEHLDDRTSSSGSQSPEPPPPHY